MEAFCRGCLVKYDEPMELLQYTEKSRRLFIYSTGLQVKRNDVITFQLCKGCSINMKAACNFKKLCRASDRKLKSYCSLKDAGVGTDFCTFLKSSDDAATFRFPLVSGNSTPANYNKIKDEDNESTCTSIRNFMTDIMQGEEMADTEARIIREVIEEEADLLDDTLDSHWLRDENSVDSDFRLDLNFSPFATPYSVNADHCYTPKREDQPQTKKYFTSITPVKNHRAVNIFTDNIKNNFNEKELCADNEKATNNLNTHNNNLNNQKSIDDVQSPVVKAVLGIELPIIEDDKSMLDISIDSGQLMNNLILPLADSEVSINNIELPSFDSLPSIPSFNSNSISNFDLPMNNNVNNTEKCYVPNDDTNYINTCKAIEEIVDAKLNIKNMNKEKPCVIDLNLERALKDENTTKYSLDDLLVSPQVTSGASTPTISNILFGEKTTTSENLISKTSPANTNIQENYEIIESVFPNENKTHSEIKNGKKEESVDADKVDSAMKEIKQIDNLPSYDESQFDLVNFICNICQKKLQSVKALCIHSVKKHNIKIIKPRNKAYIYKLRVCQLCGKELKNSQNFYRHLKTHQKPQMEIIKCDHCSLEFSSIYTLRHHKASHNAKSIKKKPGKLVCTTCGASSTTIANLRLHQRRHEKKYNCKCAECGKEFYTQSELTVHMRNHTGEKPHTCVHCEKKFSRKDALVKHVKIHINDRPFKCEYCHDKFTTNTQMNVHIRKSIKCRRKRGILIDPVIEINNDLVEIEQENVETVVIKQVVVTGLPYIDTEMSN